MTTLFQKIWVDSEIRKVFGHKIYHCEEYGEAMVALCHLLYSARKGLTDLQMNRILNSEPFNVSEFIAINLIAEARKLRLIIRKRSGTPCFVLTDSYIPPRG